MGKKKDAVVVDETPVKVKYKQYIRELEVEKLALEVREAQRCDQLAEMTHKTTVAHEGHTGTFRLYGQVDSTSVERLRLNTARYAAAYPDAPIELVISSGGGSMFDGWVLFDHLRALSESGHKITTTVRGMAGSMAGIIAQAGDVRVIGPESYLVIHEPSSMSWGKTSDMKDEVEVMKRLWRQADEVFARRSTMTAKEIRAKTIKFDWYVSSKEAKKLKFADKIG